MPIAAKLSRKLYDTFGDEAAQAMVDWMHRMESQRSELRELNDLRFARIDARFDQVDARFNEFETRVDARFAQVDARFDLVDSRFDALRHEMAAGFAQLESKLDRRIADMMKWCFVFWVGSTVSLVVALSVLGRIGR